MGKTDFVIVLENDEFSAVAEDGVVMVLYESGTFQKTAEEARELARLNGYVNSLGFRMRDEYGK